MLDIAFIAVISVGFICLKFFAGWCENQIENKKD
jgi:hypothetical protein